jgi:hypothetical protein
MTNQEFAAGLRQLAQLLEDNPEMVQPWLEHIQFMCRGKAAFAATVKAFGAGKKSESDANTSFASIDFTPDSFPLPVVVHGFKAAICERVTGTRVVPRQVIPAKPAEPERIIEEHEEETVEYVCGPILELEAENA